MPAWQQAPLVKPTQAASGPSAPAPSWKQAPLVSPVESAPFARDFGGPEQQPDPALQAALDARATAQRGQMGAPLPKGDALGPISPGVAPTGGGMARVAAAGSPASGALNKGSYLDPLGQGLTFGGADEIAGVVGGLSAVMQGKSFSEGYDATRTDALSSLDAQRFRDPVGSGIAEFAGAVPTAALPIGAAARGATMAGKIGGGMLAGAATGAAYGAGTGESLEDRGMNAATQGVVGAGVGAVAPVAARAIGAGAGAAWRYGSAPFRERVSPGVAKIAGALERDAASPTNAAALGPQGMIADLGPNVRQQAAAVAAVPGEGQRIVKSALTSRAGDAGKRVRADVDTALGPNSNVVATAEAIAAQRAAAAAPLYQQAYAAPIQMTPGIQAALSTPSGKAALARAARLAADEGAPIDVANLDTRALDYVKRALDDMGGAAQRGGAKEQFRAIGGIRAAILKDLDAQNPTYAQARATYAGPSSVLDALDAGQSVFTRVVSPDELRGAMRSMSPGERAAFTQGSRAAVEEIMATARNDAGAALRELAEKGWNAEKLRLIAGGPAADTLITALKREKVFAESGYKIAGNSETAAREAGIADIGGRPGGMGNLQSSFVYGGWTGPARAAVIGAANKVIGAFVRGSTEQRAAAIGRILVATGRERDVMVRQLMLYRKLYANNQAITDAVDVASRALLVSAGRTQAGNAVAVFQPRALANQ